MDLGKWHLKKYSMTWEIPLLMAIPKGKVSVKLPLQSNLTHEYVQMEKSESTYLSSDLQLTCKYV